MEELLWRTIQQFLQKLNTESTYDPATSLLGIYLEELKSVCPKDIYTPMFSAPLLTIAKMQKQPASNDR